MPRRPTRYRDDPIGYQRYRIEQNAIKRTSYARRKAEQGTPPQILLDEAFGIAEGVYLPPEGAGPRHQLTFQSPETRYQMIEVSPYTPAPRRDHAPRAETSSRSFTIPEAPSGPLESSSLGRMCVRIPYRPESPSARYSPSRPPGFEEAVDIQQAKMASLAISQPEQSSIASSSRAVVRYPRDSSTRVGGRSPRNSSSKVVDRPFRDSSYMEVDSSPRGSPYKMDKRSPRDSGIRGEPCQGGRLEREARLSKDGERKRKKRLMENQDSDCHIVEERSQGSSRVRFSPAYERYLEEGMDHDDAAFAYFEECCARGNERHGNTYGSGDGGASRIGWR